MTLIGPGRQEQGRHFVCAMVLSPGSGKDSERPHQGCDMACPLSRVIAEDRSMSFLFGEGPQRRGGEGRVNLS